MGAWWQWPQKPWQGNRIFSSSSSRSSFFPDFQRLMIPGDITETAFFSPGSNAIASGAVTDLPHPFHQTQFLSPRGATPACTAATYMVPTKRKREAGNGTVVEGAIGSRLATTELLTQQQLQQQQQQQHMDAEIEALLRLHQSSLRVGLQNSVRRHCRDLIMAFARQARSRIQAVDAELQAAAQRKAELEARVKHLAVESQAWLAVARDNEAAVAALRAGLDQAVGAVNRAPVAPAPPGPAAPVFTADVVNNDDNCDDAQSCCFAGDHRDAGETGTGTLGRCRACRDSNAAVVSTVSVLLLPCRHLCLCSECDRTGTDACPVCGSAKTASIHVIFP